MTLESNAEGGAGVDDAAEARRLARIPPLPAVPLVPDKNQGPSQPHRRRTNSTNNNSNNASGSSNNNNHAGRQNGPRSDSRASNSHTPGSGGKGTATTQTVGADTKGPRKPRGNRAPGKADSKGDGAAKAAKANTPGAGPNHNRTQQRSVAVRSGDALATAGEPNGERAQKQRSRQRSRKSGKAQAGGVGGGRTFSGRLTLDAGDGDSDAMEGLAHAVSPEAAAAGLSSVLARRLICGDYECMICCDKVRARNAVWQCDHCWAIFHLGCVRRWAQACVADGTSSRWRCPGCQHARAAEPTHYVCFCGAQCNPEPVRGAVPHACTRICGRKRGPHCPHACAQPCHPGPCAPCTALAPEQSCFCGRVSHQPRCGADFDPARAARSCGAVCGEVLGCGLHTCTQPCHAGLCAACPRQEQQTCFCGRHTRAVRCGEGGGAAYSCGEPCDAPRGCGNHRCERTCHPVESDPHTTCPLDPEVASTCHCGAHAAADLGAPRASCTDAVPSCGRPCGRLLSGCAHACRAVCHAGPCPPCAEPVSAPCVCGATTVPTECHASRADPPRCERLCGRKRACGRHRCAVRCCASAHEGTTPAPGDAHECALVCGRALRCRQHKCAEPCHRGVCPPCTHVGLDAVSCACGLTRLEPPVACGAELPPCHHPCRRQRACGHVSLTPHECHEGPCPPCAVLVSAQCMCGAREMRAIACHRSHAASCGTPCRRLLPCGGHQCQRTCHRPDDPCLGGHPCRQACGKPRKACGHPCALPCHTPTMCDESQPCAAMARAACACGRITAERPCGATTGAAAPGALAIPCDDVCMIAQRNRRLALAFNLPERAEAPLAGLVRATYPEELLDFTRTNTSWVRGIENLVAAFIADTRRSTLRFVSMKQPLREFLHALAPFYGCASRSVDYEPHRSVCWDRSPNATIPSIILSSAIRYTHAPQIVCSLRANDANDSADDGVESDDGSTDRKRQPIDYIAIRDLRHGLTADELGAEIRKLFPGAPFTTRWKDEDLVEMYCTDSAAKHEHLPKWLSVLKKKLPHLGVAGLVTAQVVAQSPPPSLLASLSTSQLSAAVSARVRRDSSSSCKQPAKAPVKEPETPEAWDDESVPENWESLNLSDN
ncbi:FKBP12-associated protein [Coemansia aciculifera]|uniref:FKBP12-associated protein n=1 Tax=Coemansia aciculifera TaxID=417176 RepID=A0A9W8INE9_9FUNG|nr:FKBP12-associated protein [Coemansia aciculifera]